MGTASTNIPHNRLIGVNRLLNGVMGTNNDQIDLGSCIPLVSDTLLELIKIPDILPEKALAPFFIGKSNSVTRLSPALGSPVYRSYDRRLHNVGWNRITLTVEIENTS